MNQQPSSDKTAAPCSSPQKATSQALLELFFSNSAHFKLKLGITAFLTGTLFAMFISLSTTINQSISNTANLICMTSYIIWFMTFNNYEEKAFDIVRGLFYFVIFVISFSYAGNTVLQQPILDWPEHWALFLCSAIGLYISIFYVVTIAINIFLTIRFLFIKLKQLLLNSTETSKGIKAILENLTIILVSIGGFTAAILAIVKSFSELISTIQ